jgi:hypothetical protein
VVVRRAVGYPGFDQMFVTLHTRQTLLPYRQKQLGGCRAQFLVQKALYLQSLRRNFFFNSVILFWHVLSCAGQSKSIIAIENLPKGE